MIAGEVLEHDDDALAYEAGDVVFAAGDPGDRMYVVRSGAVELRVGDTVVETVTADGFFGEMALIDGAPRSATAVAREATRLVPVSRQRFEYLAQQTPGFVLDVMKTMIRRLREAKAAI